MYREEVPAISNVVRNPYCTVYILRSTPISFDLEHVYIHIRAGIGGFTINYCTRVEPECIIVNSGGDIL